MFDEEIRASRPVSRRSAAADGDSSAAPARHAGERIPDGDPVQHASHPVQPLGRPPEAGSHPSGRRGPNLRQSLTLLTASALVPGLPQRRLAPRHLRLPGLAAATSFWILLLASALGLAAARGPALDILLGPRLSLLFSALLALLALIWAYFMAITLKGLRPKRFGLPGRLVLGTTALLLTALTSGSMLAGAGTLNSARTALDRTFAASGSVAPANGRYNILLLGGDAGADRTGRRPDSISVMSIDPATGDTAVFSIPRNLQNAPFPETSPMHSVFPQGYNCGDDCIVNALYSEVNNNHRSLYPGSADPGAQAMMESASAILGIDIRSYALVDMGAFGELIDAMGGITVTSGGWVPVTAGEIPGTDPVRHYPPSEWMRPGTLKLDGFHAEWFARSREFTSDYNRIRRQQCIEAAISSRLSPNLLLRRFGPITTAASKAVETNIPRSQAGTFLDAALRSRQGERRRLTIGEPDFPAMFSTYPDFDEVHRRVEEVLSQAPSSSASGERIGSRAPLGAVVPAGPRVSSSTRAASLFPAADRAPDGTQITPEYLNRLAENWDDATLLAILRDNGDCSTGD